MSEYPELNQLHEWVEEHQCSFKALEEPNDEFPFLVRFFHKHGHWDIYIIDEYNDFSEKNAPLCLFLVLFALEDYEEMDDILSWTNHYGLNPAHPTWIAYYKGLGQIYKEVGELLGGIDSSITSLDYQLRSYAFDALVNGQ